jgi:hypothetical protein
MVMNFDGPIFDILPIKKLDPFFSFGSGKGL